MFGRKRSGGGALGAERLRELAMEQAAMGLYRYTFEGKLLYIDKGALSVLEAGDRFTAPEKAIGRNVREIASKVDAPGSLREDVRRDGKIFGRLGHFRTLAGKDKWVMQDAMLVHDPDTNAECVQVMIRDVTERRRLEEEARVAERRFRDVLETIPLIAVQINTKGTVTFCNQYLAGLSGWERSEIVGRDWFDTFVPESHRQRLREVFLEKAEKTGTLPSQVENEILTRKGETRLILWSNTLLRGEMGVVAGFNAIGQDISDRKRVEQALSKSARISERLRLLILTLNQCKSLEEMCMPLADAGMDVCSMDAAAVFLVQGKEALLSYHTGLPEEYAEKIRREMLDAPFFQAALRSESPFSLEDLEDDLADPPSKYGLRNTVLLPLRAAGTYFGFLCLASTMGHAPSQSSLMNLSMLALECESLFQRLRAEQALRESEEKYRTILESMREGYYEVDLKGNFRFFNDALTKIFGFSPDEMLGMNFREYYPDEATTNRAIRTFNHIYKTGIDLELFDWNIKRKDGTEAVFEASATLMRNRQGEPLGFRGIVRDVSARKEAERARRKAEFRYRELFENANDVVYTHALDGTLTSLNKAGELVTGYTREELLGRNILDLLHPEFRARAQEMLANKIAGAATTQYEAAILTKEGATIPVEIGTRLVFEDGKPAGVQGIARDIHERVAAQAEHHRMELQIRHAQKLESLGVLAGGLAHDFNNLLVGILGNAGLVLGKLAEDDALRTYIRRIEGSARRAADLTNQMLAYSGRGTFQAGPLDLSKLAIEMSQLLEAAISKKATLVYECAEGLPMIQGDPVQINQVIMNLITNASDALGESTGTITIRTYSRFEKASALKGVFITHEVKEGYFVHLEVADTGCGIDAETMTRLFDPFFTTKFTGRGLGLAAALGIVHGHEGCVFVESEVGKGTLFRVLFPATSPIEVLPRPPQVMSRDMPPPPSEGDSLDVISAQHVEFASSVTPVLVVDDEENVRMVAVEALTMCGYNVLEAANGEEALDIFRRNNHELSLVLLDLMMPGMSGEEVFAAIHALRADVPVILSSGYHEDDVAGRFTGARPRGFIHKPYRPALVYCM